MSDAGGSVTLIFYRIDSVFNEPFLNILAAAAQLSSFTHVELAIGDTAGEFGQMKNVVRVFNDDVGETAILEECKRCGTDRCLCCRC